MLSLHVVVRFTNQTRKNKWVGTSIVSKHAYICNIVVGFRWIYTSVCLWLENFQIITKLCIDLYIPNKTNCFVQLLYSEEYDTLVLVNYIVFCRYFVYLVLLRMQINCCIITNQILVSFHGKRITLFGMILYYTISSQPYI